MNIPRNLRLMAEASRVYGYLRQRARHASPLQRQTGFTLIEAIVVIVITAAIAAAVAVFIRVPVNF